MYIIYRERMPFHAFNDRIPSEAIQLKYPL